jgi:endonuclease III
MPAQREENTELNTKLARVIEELRTHDYDMKIFFDENVFNLLHINKNSLLDDSENDLRMLFFFCLTQRRQQSLEDIIKGMDYFNKNQSNLVQILKRNFENPEEKFKRVKEIVYPPRERGVGIGQKIGSLFLELLVLHGNSCQEVLPYLYVPIDANVQGVLKKLGVKAGVPRVGTTTNESKFRRFQEWLAKIAGENNSYRIHFDYLWYIGHEFCRKNNCDKCWIRHICKSSVT